MSYTQTSEKAVWSRSEGESSLGAHVTAFYGERAQAGVGFAFVVADDQMPRIVYWGKPLSHPEQLANAYDALRPQRVSGALDDTNWPSVLPTQAEAWSGVSRFVVRRKGIELFCSFVVANVSFGADAQTVTVQALDEEQHVGIEWQCALTPSGLVRQRAVVSNLQGAQGDLAVDKVELAFPVSEVDSEILTTTGHHLRERSPQRQPFNLGRLEKASTVGRPDFDASLLLSAGVPGFGFTQGEVYSVHVAWSGNSLLSAERLSYTQGLIGGAETLAGGEIELDESQTYTTPWIYGSYGIGLNQVASRFHEYLRALHPQFAERPRPVILNTWEAVYFDHSFDTLKALADKAKESGVERFVVDDGWFMHRRDDTAGLGDWQIDPAVWPAGAKSLDALADYVHELGMEFGLWFEPEMVNQDSDIARAHPDWIVRPTRNRLPMTGRSQQVLDLTNPDAYDYVFSAMDGLVARLNIDYIKWDHNRLVTEAVSPRSGRPCVHRQTEAVYRIFRELKSKHGGLEIESCSSGGGRVDLGILEVADRIWASDCVDPVERADIQRYTSLLVPPEMIGEHVGASPAHSTRRSTSQELRMATAFFGHMGIEWNLLKEPQDALQTLAGWVKAFKERRGIFATGSAVHGDSSDPGIRLDGVVSEDRSHGVYRFTQLTTSKIYPSSPVRLPGLKADALYRVKPLSVSEDITQIGNAQSDSAWWNADGVVLPGELLMSSGLRTPSLHPAQAVLFEAELV
ncbi:MAG: alpha-galactosidase [Bifidobacterium psychraerophilum]|uniref:alpha-galactosidase n=1 Tax=Bifidobacterium psychraerophilum TaxID=218140 RepID=UPI0039E802B9